MYSGQIARRVEQAIAGSGISVAEVAHRSGIPRTTLIRRLQNGAASPFTVVEIEAIALTLGIAASDLA